MKFFFRRQYARTMFFLRGGWGALSAAGRRFPPVEATVLASFVVSLLLLSFGAGLINHAGTNYMRAATWVARVQEVRTVLAKLDTNVSDAALALQGFLRNGDGTKLQEWNRLTGEIGAEQAILAQLMNDQPGGQRSLADLRASIARFLSLLDTSVTLFNQRRLEEARDLIYSGSGFADRQAIRSRIEAISAAEQKLLDYSQVKLEADWKETLTIIALTLLAEAVMLGLVFWSIRREMVKRRCAERALITAKEAADSANRAKSTFLAAMSHEVRTPLNGLMGLLELLSLSHLESEQRSTLEIVRESSHALLRVLDDILDFSKIEAGKLDICPEVASVSDIVQDVRNMFTGNASSKGLLLQHSVDPVLSPALVVDPVRVRQILNNFVSNAIKFTSQGTIDVRADLIDRVADREQVRFTVRDTGIGISEEDRQQLFRPFHQVLGDAGRRAGGTGLGLTICRRLATMMGGTVEMQSTPGQGTTVTLTLSLPIADPQALSRVDRTRLQDLVRANGDMRRAAPSIKQAQQDGTLVLVVDDHPTNRLLVLRQINALGYAGECVQDGVQALDKWKTGRFGLVLTDCNMPEMDGYELTRCIRQIEGEGGGTRTPIVACTAYALKGEAEKCLAAGMDDYLAKPIVLGQLSKKLEQWLPIQMNFDQPGSAEPTRAVKGSGRQMPVENTQEPAGAMPLDLTRFMEMCGGGAVEVRETLMHFRRLNDEDVAQLRHAVAQGDLEGIARSSHRIIGASGMAGANAFEAVCRRINCSSRAGHIETVIADMLTCEREFVRLNTFVDSYLNEANQSKELAVEQAETGNRGA